MLFLLGMLLTAATLTACRAYGVRRVAVLASIAGAMLSIQVEAVLGLAPFVGLLFGAQLERHHSYGQVIAGMVVPGGLLALWLLLAAYGSVEQREEQVEQLVGQLQAMGLAMTDEGYSLRELALAGLRLRPSTEFISLMLMGVLAYRLGFAVAPRLNLSVPDPLPFALWKPWPELIWLLIVGLVLKLVAGGFLEELGLNLLVVVTAVYAVHGAAVCRFFAARLGVPRLLEFLVYGFFAMTAGLSVMLLALAGLLDTRFDWRRLDAAGPQDPPEKYADNIA
jgi:hypothetical protein